MSASSAKPNATPAPPRRCLVITARELGRTLLDLSVFESLTASGRQLVVVSPFRHAAVLDPTLLRLRLDHTPEHLGAPLSITREDCDVAMLRQLAAAEAVVLDDSIAASRLAAKSGASQRWGVGSAVHKLWLNARVAPSPASNSHKRHDRHSHEDRRELIGAMKLPWQNRTQLVTTGGWRETGQERLAAARIPVGKAPILGIYLGDLGSRQTSSWPAKRFEELVPALRKKFPTWNFVLLASQDELWQTVLLYEKTGKLHPVIGPDLTLDSLAAVMMQLDMVIANDSWMLTLAASVGTRCLALLEEHAQRFGPWGPQHRAIECKPLTRLAVDDVVEVTAELSKLIRSRGQKISGKRVQRSS